MPLHLRRVLIQREKFPTDAFYPFSLEVLQKTTQVQFQSPISFFVGENGSGKSTLLRAITQRCGIHIWQDEVLKPYRHNPYENQLMGCLSIDWVDGAVPGSFFGSEIFHDFTHILDEWAANDPGQLKYFGGDSLVTKSHGEGLMAFFKSRYRIRGLHCLDEPETALSPRRQLELLEVLIQMGRAGHAQFIIATHSPILLACPGAEIFSFDHMPLRKIGYEETDHYRVYRGFLADRASYLEQFSKKISKE